MTDSAVFHDSVTDDFRDAAGAITDFPSSGSGAGTPGYEYDYVERTSNLTVTATSDAAAQDLIVGNAVTYDGSTRVKIEAFVVAASITPNQNVVLNLYDGSTDLGRLCNIGPPTGTGASGSMVMMMKGERFLTPSAGAHTYKVRAWKTGGTAVVAADTGGAGLYLPAWYRITKA